MQGENIEFDSFKESVCYFIINLFMSNNLLIDRYKEVAKEWHPTKNGDLQPEQFTYGSSRRIWWKCSEGHEWEATIYKRNVGRGCPTCSRARVKPGHSLQDKFPNLISEWHPTKNGKLKPDGVSAFSEKKVWWKCDNDHEYEMIVYYRSRGSGCKECRKIKKGDSLMDKIPMLAQEWHPTKNGKLKPYDVIPGSGKKVWWKCNKGHEWETTVIHRSKGYDCPICRKGEKIRTGYKNVLIDKNFGYYHPELINEWDFYKNGKLTPFHVTPQSHKKVWWVCTKGHKYEMTVFRRHIGSNCSYCHGHKVIYETSLAYNKPELAKEWHPTKNDKLKPTNIKYKSDKKVWWQCLKGHEWVSTVSNRSNGNGCPYCTGRKVCDDNCLNSLFPEIAKQWHPTKNGKIIPNDVTCGTNRKFWWICEKGHEWKTSITSRTVKKAGCLYCAGHMVDSSNSFGDLYPQQAKKWDYKKNNNLTPYDVTPSSHKRMWWKCYKGHNWQAKVYNISRDEGCPYCSCGSFSKVAIDWIESVSKKENINIKHAMNGGEYEIKNGKKTIKVDGYCKETNTIY
jgi:hypothetical protein